MLLSVEGDRPQAAMPYCAKLSAPGLVSLRAAPYDLMARRRRPPHGPAETRP